jgi:aminoglycoside phosphotransferase (APT) family kinase protein
VLITSSGAEVVIAGDVVTKLHRRGTDLQALRQRLRAAARCPELASPLSDEPQRVGERWLTRWPRLDVAAPDPSDLPWAAAGAVLARLHREPIAGLEIPEGGWARLNRAVARLGDAPAAGVIRRAAARVPRVSEDRPITVVHGDFHLGQLGRRGGALLLMDVDDLGIGDPAADLGRPAGFWAAGLLPDADWHAFVDGYREAGGPAVPVGDVWPALEPFARAAVVAAAANDPGDELLIAACARMG